MIKRIHFVALAVTVSLTFCTDASAQNSWGEFKNKVQETVKKVVPGGDDAPELSSADLKILSSCGLKGLSLEPVGEPQKGGRESALVGKIPVKAAEQLDWRSKLPAAWQCDNRTLADICDKVSSYNKKRQKDPQAYEWNEVLAVVDADYNDGELSRRLEALETAAEAYNECKAVFGDGSSSEQDKRVAARALANAVKNQYYKRALNSSMDCLYLLIKNVKVVSTLRKATSKGNADAQPDAKPSGSGSRDDEK